MILSQPKKRRVFKLLAALTSTVVCLSILFGVDLYLHHKHGVNLRGYRGPALSRKQSGEKRLAILGGSTTWGFGLSAGQDFPAQLQRLLLQGSEKKNAINTLNLGSNNDGAYSFKYTLKDYDYLDYDAVVLYSGYNDLGAPNSYIFRHRSPVFIWTGYLPLLPSLTVDKMTVWKQQLFGENTKAVFQPPNRKSAETSPALQKQVGPLTGANKSSSQSPGATCPPEWQFYCEQIYETANLLLKQGKPVLIVTEPYISDKHVAQQAALENMLAIRFAGEPKLRYLNLGWTVDLRDRALCWDGMHLTEEGNRRIAEAMASPALELLRQ
jgi:lysophospholipase L1-like esterase